MTNTDSQTAVQRAVVGAGEFAFVSGLGPFDLHDADAPIPEYVEAQTAKIFANLDDILRAAGLSKNHVVSVRISLIDYPRLFERMNRAYAAYFPSDRQPARSCVGVSALTRGASVEMDFVVHRSPGEPE